MPDPGAVVRRAEEVAARVLAEPLPAPRLLVAIAGPPASGKSTLAQALADRLTALGHAAVNVPMDGFHLDDRVLEARGLRARKGAPQTFDAAGFVHAVGRLRREAEVVLPEFDRTREIAIAGRIVVGPEHRVAVVEGNYLLYDAPPWAALREDWHVSVFLDVPRDELKARLTERWRGFGYSEVELAGKIGDNDLPNAEAVLTRRLPADLTFDG